MKQASIPRTNLNVFRKHAPFAEHYDKTLQHFEKPLNVLNKNLSEFLADNLYNSFSIGRPDYMLNLLFFTSEWFTIAFISLFGYPCFHLTQYGLYFSTAFVIQFLFNTLLSINFLMPKFIFKNIQPFFVLLVLDFSEL